jgi:hypothetical protein
MIAWDEKKVSEKKLTLFDKQLSYIERKEA